MLVRMQDAEARSKAQRLRFRLTCDPLEFVSQVNREPAAKTKGHVVLAPNQLTDFAVAAKIAATAMGAFFATPEDYAKYDESQGVMYARSCNSAKRQQAAGSTNGQP